MPDESWGTLGLNDLCLLTISKFRVNGCFIGNNSSSVQGVSVMLLVYGLWIWPPHLFQIFSVFG